MRITQTLLITGFALLLCRAVPAAAQETTSNDDGVVEKIEVQRADSHKTKYPTLRFLKDNRVFIRSQLDLLKTQVTRERTGQAEIIDGRYLWLNELAQAIAAAGDSVGVARSNAAVDTLLDSVKRLGELDDTLRLMEKLLAQQRKRLLELEQDFVGRQETSLVIVLRGMAGRSAPATIVVGEGNDFVRLDLTAEQRASLEEGGIAQLFHEFVEPRRHTYLIAFEGNGWGDTDPASVTIDVERDHMTFLEIDASQLDRNLDAMGLLTSVWSR